MSIDVFSPVCKVIISLFKYVIYAFLAVLLPILFMFLVFFLWHIIKGDKIPLRKKRVHLHYAKRTNLLKVLFWDFPKRLAADFFNRNPDCFDTYGVHVFCGEQGSGKSIALVHFIKMIKERNPMCRISSNISIDFQDGTITDWKNILQHNNGEFGQVIVLDEIQNWFSSNESKDFPPEMLTEITQQRKQRKIVVGTSQVFTRISKPIREQITLLYKPMTIAGCLTVVRVYKVRLKDDGTVDKMRFMRWYCFVHDDELRNAYDTYEKVSRISLNGFQPRSEQISGNPVSSSPRVIIRR